jgi:outer membrane protein
MRVLKVIAASAALATASLVSVPAFAQAGSVIVIDGGRVRSASQAGRDMTQKLRAIENQMQQELQPEAQWLQTEGQAIQQQRGNQTEDQVRRNAQLTQRMQAYQQRAQTFAARRQQMARDLEYTQLMAQNEFARHAKPALDQVLAQRRAAVAIDSSVIQGNTNNVDATTDLISRLDGSVRTINVTRQSAPQQQQQR